MLDISSYIQIFLSGPLTKLIWLQLFGGAFKEAVTDKKKYEVLFTQW